MEQDLQSADLLDPNPDIHALFCHYNDLYFQGKLEACTVDWSTARMTLCAGICKYSVGGGCAIRLSEPLLKYRSSMELKETLLHEMIHAYLWLTDRNKDHDDHGPCFQELMREINNSKLPDHQRPDQGYDITIYHNFSLEVDSYRRHHWRCKCCGDVIKRAMNRPPSKSDCMLKSAGNSVCQYDQCHWHRHQRLCGGEYEKTAEPAGYQDRRKNSSKHSGKQDGEVSKLSAGNATRKTGRKKKLTVNDFDGAKKGEKGEATHLQGSKIAPLEKFFAAKDKDNEKQEELATARLENEGCRASCSDTSSEDEMDEKSVKRRRGDKSEKLGEEALCTEAQEKSKTVLGKRQERTHEVDVCNRPLNDCTVIIGWMGWCAFEGEEDEEGVEALINNRRQRRMQERACELHRRQEAHTICKVERDVGAPEWPVNEAASTALTSNTAELGQVNERVLEPVGLTSPVLLVEELPPMNLGSEHAIDIKTNRMEGLSKDSKDLTSNEFFERQKSRDCTRVSILVTPGECSTTETDVGMSKHTEVLGSPSFDVLLSREDMATCINKGKCAELDSSVSEKIDATNNLQDLNNHVSCPEKLRCPFATTTGIEETKAARLVSKSLIDDEVTVIQINDMDEDIDVGSMKQSESKRADTGSGVLQDNHVICPEKLRCASATISGMQETKDARLVSNSLIDDEVTVIQINDMDEDLDVGSTKQSESNRTVTDSGVRCQDRSGNEFAMDSLKSDSHRISQGRINGASGEIGDAKVTKTTVKCERRGKRVRESCKQIQDDSGAGEGPSVTCPICHEILSGDIQNTQFNTKFNRHIDTCMRSQLKAT